MPFGTIKTEYTENRIKTIRIHKNKEYINTFIFVKECLYCKTGYLG